MSIEETIWILEFVVDSEAYADKFRDACRLAVAALEKQMPKKPVEVGYEISVPNLWGISWFNPLLPLLWASDRL